MGTNTMWGSPALLSTDANNNTVLVGADGVIIPTLGANTITVGAGGQYATLQAALDYIATQDTYTNLAVSGSTASVTASTKLVTLAGTDVYDTGARVHMGDLWSGDGGLNWYEIASPLSPTEMLLEIAYQGSTLSAVASEFARPIWYSIILLPGEHGLVEWPASKPLFVDIQALPGAVIVDRVTQIQQTVFFPQQGHVILRSVKGLAPKGRSAWCADTGTLGTTGKHSTSIIECRDNCDIRSMGVDIYLPGAAGGIGRFVANNSYFEAGQDIFANVPVDGKFFKTCEVVGTTSIKAYGVVLAIRMFVGDTYAVDCAFKIRIPGTAPSGPSYLFDISQSANYKLDRCTIDFEVNGAATLAAVLNTSSGGAQIANTELNNCVLRGVSTSGTPVISVAKTYTGAGTLKLQNCVKNGFGNGAGGTLTTNTVEANCSA